MVAVDELNPVWNYTPAWSRKLTERRLAWLERHPAVASAGGGFASMVWAVANRLMPTGRIAGVRNVTLTFAVADSLLTYFWLTMGLADEGNPVLASLFHLTGDGLGLTLRAGWAVALVLFLAHYAPLHRWPRLGLVVAYVVSTAVVVWHTIGALSVLHVIHTSAYGIWT